MAKKTLDVDGLKKIIRQITGRPEPDDGEFAIPCIIKGSGYIWCYQPKDREIKRILRGTKVFIIDEREDPRGRIMVYTESGDVILIEQEQLSVLGFN